MHTKKEQKNDLTKSVGEVCSYQKISLDKGKLKRKILLDRNSMQVMIHFDEFVDIEGKKVKNRDGKHQRLSTFLQILQAYGDYSFGEETINSDILNKCNLFITGTRPLPFQDSEIDAISNFVYNGGSLLLMSNHEPYHQHDLKLARVFGVELTNETYWSGNRLIRSPLTCEDFANHPIISKQPVIRSLNSNNSSNISSIITHTTCRIESLFGEKFAFLPETMVEYEKGVIELDERKVFGLAINGLKEDMANFKGKIIVLADSGFIGDANSTYPANGLIELADNITFVENILSYLLFDW